MVQLPELNGPIFADSLAAELDKYHESYFKIGSWVLVHRDLAIDSDMRAKYTMDAAYNAALNHPEFQPKIAYEKREQGLLLDAVWPGNVTTNSSRR